MQVDADDDSITRYIVQHYRYDDVRHERRWLTVAAFDNELEFEAYLDEAVARLTAAKQSPGAIRTKPYAALNCAPDISSERAVNAHLSG